MGIGSPQIYSMCREKPPLARVFAICFFDSPPISMASGPATDSKASESISILAISRKNRSSRTRSFPIHSSYLTLLRKACSQEMQAARRWAKKRPTRPIKLFRACNHTRGCRRTRPANPRSLKTSPTKPVASQNLSAQGISCWMILRVLSNSAIS